MPILSTRESEIALLYGSGLSAREVGSALDISHHTVNDHLRRIKHKTGVSDRTGLAMWICRAGGLPILYILMCSQRGIQRSSEQ